MPWLMNAVVVYALLMLFGGIGGYATAKSVPSLVAGIASGALLLGSAALSKTHPRIGFFLATLITLALVVIFIRRYVETHKPMNMGLVGLSLVMLLLLIVGHFMG
jgi:uncharacterized membrane protein (UPF0136 family)